MVVVDLKWLVFLLCVALSAGAIESDAVNSPAQHSQRRDTHSLDAQADASGLQ